MSLTFYMMLLAVLALSVVLLAALAIYWHAEARDWMQTAMDICLNSGKKTGGDAHGNRSADQGASEVRR